jgi:hypothetical protein
MFVSEEGSLTESIAGSGCFLGRVRKFCPGYQLRPIEFLRIAQAPLRCYSTCARYPPVRFRGLVIRRPCTNCPRRHVAGGYARDSPPALRHSESAARGALALAHLRLNLRADEEILKPHSSATALAGIARYPRRILRRALSEEDAREVTGRAAADRWKDAVGTVSCGRRIVGGRRVHPGEQ